MSGRIVVAALGIALGCMFTADAQEKRALELLVIVAVTPEEHDDAARFYAEKAQDARAEEERHLDMGARYVEEAEDDAALRRDQKRHCDRIARLHREMAEEYEALSKSHADKARKLRTGSEGHSH